MSNYIGLPLADVINELKGKQVEIIYNNSDKLAVFDSQLVVAYKEIDNNVTIVCSNFQLKV